MLVFFRVCEIVYWFGAGFGGWLIDQAHVIVLHCVACYTQTTQTRSASARGCCAVSTHTDTQQALWLNVVELRYRWLNFTSATTALQSSRSSSCIYYIHSDIILSASGYAPATPHASAGLTCPLGSSHVCHEITEKKILIHAECAYWRERQPEKF